MITTSTSSIPGPKIMLIGESGSGKTHSLRTLLEAGITPFVLFTEPGMETLGDMPDGSWHYKYVKPFTQKWSDIHNMMQKMNMLSFENMSKVTDPYKTSYTGLLDTLNACNNFTCDCHGTAFGDVSKWSTDRAFVLDSLSGLGDMAMANAVGGKPTRSPAEWGMAQNAVRAILQPLTTATQCTFVLTGHLARERDEITGGSQVMVNTLGQKLAPDLPKMFSDVVMAVREVNVYTWDTAAANTALKARNLPIAAKQQPSFVPLIEKWKKNGGKIVPTVNT